MIPGSPSEGFGMFDYQSVFHVGVRVLDFDRALESIGRGMGLTWARPVERDQPWWSPEGGSAVARLRFTYSTAGPQHVELLHGSPGSVWDATDADGPGIHHTGIWVDDVAATTEWLLAAGWTLVAANTAPDEGYGTFSYVRSPEGLLVEPVSAAVRDAMERWFASDSSGGT